MNAKIITMSKNKLKCFVIMPFSRSSEIHSEEYWTNHFNNFLKPKIEKIPALEAFRSDELRGDILKEIINDLFNSYIVVADLTDHNPNVFWELGVRLSFKYRTITIAEKGTILPFDVSTKNTIFYDPKDPINDVQFSDNFNKALIDCLTDPNKSDSIVLETLVGRNRDLAKEDKLEKTIKHYYNEIFGFFDDLFSGKSIGAIERQYIIKYVDDNSKELSKYFGFHRELNRKDEQQTFYFLKSKYRIDFKTNFHSIIVYPKRSAPTNISMSYPKEAKALYEKMLKEVKDSVNKKFNIKI